MQKFDSYGCLLSLDFIKVPRIIEILNEAKVFLRLFLMLPFDTIASLFSDCERHGSEMGDCNF
ncbi:Uncharacterized protein XB16_0306 [Leptospira santarosai]|uniref:Uncharacterized protein n=1 Tax=Leptospira santarosai TaxID=28183 RepID=A0A2P1QP19_9LEPT|nr:Uncharacterized protein XB16_0306 [Leptospira santarosai]